MKRKHPELEPKPDPIPKPRYHFENPYHEKIKAFAFHYIAQSVLVGHVNVLWKLSYERVGFSSIGSCADGLINLKSLIDKLTKIDESSNDKKYAFILSELNNVLLIFMEYYEASVDEFCEGIPPASMEEEDTTSMEEEDTADESLVSDVKKARASFLVSSPCLFPDVSNKPSTNSSSDKGVSCRFTSPPGY